jgi:uncharacterized membrane protein YphA (DoxX/SURF4 family)
MSRDKIAMGLRFLLGAVFIISAISKLLVPGLFEIAIVDQGLAATREQAAYPARLLIAFELFLGIALFFPFFLKRVILPLVILTLAAFTLLQGYQIFFGEQTADCGCFGKLLPMSSGESLLKNLVLLGLSFWLWKVTREERRNFILPASLAVASVAAVFLMAPVRGNYDGSFAKYTQFERAGRVDLTSGDKLVAIFNADCEHCQQAARELKQLMETDNDLPEMYVLLFSENDGLTQAFWEVTATAYPYHLISENEFFDLIGDSPPRIYWLHDGNINARWDDSFVENIRSAFTVQAEKKS